MSEKPCRRWVYWLVGTLAVLLVVCGGMLYALWGVVQGITGLFVTPKNPTNEPQAVLELHGPPPAAMAFSSDGKLLAVLTPKWREVEDAAPAAELPPDRPQLVVHDVATKTKIFTTTFLRWPRSMSFSPDGKRLVIGLGGLVEPGPDKKPPTELVVLTVPDFTEISRHTPGEDFQPDRLMFNPEGTLLITIRTDMVSAPKTVSAWRFPELTASPKFTTAVVTPYCATTVGETVLIGGSRNDGSSALEQFDLSGQRIRNWAIPDPIYGPIYAVHSDPSVKTVTAYFFDASQTFDSTTGKPIGKRTPYPVDGAGFGGVSANGSHIALPWSIPSSMAPDFRPWYQKGNFLHVGNLKTGASRKWWTGVNGVAAFSPDGKLIAAEFNGNPQTRPICMKVWVSP